MSVGRIIQDRTAIVGIGQSRMGKGLEESERSLAVTAVRAALEDAGISPSEVDGLTSFDMEVTQAEEIARDLAMGDIGFVALSPAGGGGGCATVGYGAMAIATGQADVVVAWRSRKRSDRASRVWAGTPERVYGKDMWVSPSGLVRPVDHVAMLARRHMHEYGTTRDHFANIALAFRAHANRNPNALMYGKPLDRQTYLNARPIAEPLGLYDCCLETDGAMAVVIASAERARDCRKPPAYIHAFAQGVGDNSQMMTNFFGVNPLRGQSWTSARGLWARSDIKAKDIKVAQIYDAFTPEVISALEGYGFCEEGGGGFFTENGAIELGGRLPINTAGGSLSEIYLHGFNLINEAVRQVRGESTAQVPDVSASFISSSDGVPTSALVLRG
jgi:acetyl-CoA acetyltransferase